VCFGQGESRATADPAAWFAAGFAGVSLLALAGAAMTLRRRPWREAVVFAALVSGVVALAVFSTAAPSTSRSCNNAGESRASGSYDCDTGFGLGLPFVAAMFFGPAVGIAALGKVGASGMARLKA